MKNKASKRRQRGWFEDMQPIDYVLSAVGLCLGTAAALFPWHVYLHPDSYGPPRMTFSRGGVIPEDEVAAQSIVGQVPGQELHTRIAGNRQAPAIDPVTTGKVNRLAPGAADFNQTFPGNGKRFEVLAVNGSRALVGDADGVYLVRPRSRLPDGTVAMSFDEDVEGWHIVTSDDRRLRPN